MCTNIVSDTIQHKKKVRNPRFLQPKRKYKLGNWFGVARSPGKRQALVCDFLQGMSYLNINFHVLEFPLTGASGRKSETTLAIAFCGVIHCCGMLFSIINVCMPIPLFNLYAFYVLLSVSGCLCCLHTQYWNVLNEWTFYVFFMCFLPVQFLIFRILFLIA